MHRSHRHSRLGPSGAVVSAALFMIQTLFEHGYGPVQATGVTLATLAGGLLACCMLTPPRRTAKVRVTVLILVLAAVLQLLVAGYPPIAVLPAVVTAALGAAEAAKRLPDVQLRRPRLAG